MDRKITVDGFRIGISSQGDHDYICLTDMVRAFEDGEALLRNWLRNKNTVEFLGIWERLNNPSFNYIEFDIIKSQVGLNRFILSAKTWVERTGAIGITARTGRYGGGTYAHTDIAYHFGMWLSPEFHLLVVKEFQRLKEDETRRLNPEWNHKRFLAKAGYRLQTDAIRDYLLPPLNLPKEKQGVVYAQEADVVNVAVFGCTAKSWAEQNPDKTGCGGNMRDFATVTQLLAVTASEILNRELIKEGVPQHTRLQRLRESALDHLRSLADSPTVQRAERQLNDSKPSEFNDALTRAVNYNPREEK